MRYLIAGILSLILINQISAQDFVGWQSAFEKSYELEKNNDYVKAMEIIKEIYIPKSYDFNIRLGWLNYILGDFPKSKEYYFKSMEIMPYSLEAKFGYVLPLSGLGEWDEVIKIYNSIIEIDPQNTIVNYRLGSIYYSRKNYQLAYNYLEVVINLYPNDYDANILFAWTNLQMGKLKLAKVLFNKSLLIKPASTSAKEGLKLIK